MKTFIILLLITGLSIAQSKQDSTEYSNAVMQKQYYQNQVTQLQSELYQKEKLLKNYYDMLAQIEVAIKTKEVLFNQKTKENKK
jgi:hypothetical protein